jgi:Uma2 family endonuclease
MSVFTTTPDFQVPEFPVRRFSVDEYHRMIESGILGEDDAVELLQGWIAPKMARNPPHDTLVDKTDEAVRRLLPRNWRIRIQSAITTANSEPEPDLAVVQGPADRYWSRHPRPEEIALVIEVSESSLDKDRKEKGPIYAEARIPYYWIVNIVDRVIEVYSQPDARGAKFVYQSADVKKAGDQVSLVIEGTEVGLIAVRELWDTA